jgi:hypothetical protein
LHATSQTQSPYQWAVPPELEVEPDPLRLRLDFHDEQVILHDYKESMVRVRRVSALDIAHALTRELDLSTGLLPPDSLWWTKTARGIRVAVWQEPQVWTIRLRMEYATRPRRFRLPMPGLVFICHPATEPPYVFAAKVRPRSTEDQLFRCPTYNVFDTGRVCPGSEAFPLDLAATPNAFFRSYFSPHSGHGKSQRHPGDIGQLWTELHRQRDYPLEDLVPHLRVADAMRLGV